MLKSSCKEPVEHKKEDDEHLPEITGEQPTEMIGVEVADGGELELSFDIERCLGSPSLQEATVLYGNDFVTLTLTPICSSMSRTHVRRG